MTARSIKTRFRAYQLGSAGASFSIYAQDQFTLIEARITDISRSNLQQELARCGKRFIDELHITSWDKDHCAIADLNEILLKYKPDSIEYPGYPPHTDTAKECLKLICNYQYTSFKNGRTVSCSAVGPEFFSELTRASPLSYGDLYYHPREIIDGESNNNSTVKLYRKGCFNIASMGDVEDIKIADRLQKSPLFKSEVDILLLAHHGADYPTNSAEFFEAVKPKLAIVSSQFDNQFEHPRPEVRQRLHSLRIPVMTTKTGDVIIESLSPHTHQFRAINLIANSEEISSIRKFDSCKSRLLPTRTPVHQYIE